jgi:TolB-like protein/Tfp pilus assembly protein PilF
VVVDHYVLEGASEQVVVAAEQISATESFASGKSVAVLPFANMSQDAATEPFTNGIYDDILTQISKIGALKVIARTTMERLDPTLSVQEIGTKLDVAAVLEGGVQRVEDRVRINVQLNDCETEAHLWAETYDRELTAANIFAIQSEIATAVAEALRAALSPEEEDRLATVPTENLAAYEAYLLGRQRLADRSTDAFAQAVDHFQQAIRFDSAFALAYVGLAEAYSLQVFYSGSPPKETLEKARVAAEQALTLNDQLGEAYNALGAVKEDTHDYEGAETAYKRALELNPNHAPTYHWYGFMLRHELGRPEEALALHRRARELDPLSGAIMSNLAGDLNALGRYDEAKDWIEKGIEIVPRFPGNYASLGSQHWFVDGRLDEAVVDYAKAFTIDPGNAYFLANLGLIHLDLGDPSEAENWIRRSIGVGPGSFLPNVAMQLLHVYRGDEAEALEYARTAFALHPYSRFYISALEFLRDDELRAGRNLEAQSLYEKGYPELLDAENPRVDRSNYRAAIGLALVLSRMGERERADLLLDRSLERIQTIPRRSFFGHGVADAQIYTIRGERQKALSALRKAIDEGWRSHWWYYLEHDLSLEPLQNEPEFREMVAEIEADMAEQLARVREMERNGELEPIPEISGATQ